MRVSAFTYVRNGLEMDYPFLQSIKSVLPIVDEFIVVIGDSQDGTKDAVLALKNDKIKIVDTVWDAQMTSGGFIFAQQSNIGLDSVSGDSDWLFHIQADEVIHEKDYGVITKAMQENLGKKEVEGFLFNFLNFFGDYDYYGPSRRYHQHEIRIVRNSPNIRSYRDSQGFRKYIDPKNSVNEKGEKLLVKKINATVYHYSYVKNPNIQLKKQIEFSKRWGADEQWIEDYKTKNKNGFNYGKIDYLKKFTGTHPQTMLQKISEKDWNFNYNPAINNMSAKEKFLRVVERLTGKQFFIYKNYRVMK